MPKLTIAARLFAEPDRARQRSLVERGMIRELWAYRELVYFLAWRDVKERDKQTGFGVLWALLPPLFSIVIFSLFFGQKRLNDSPHHPPNPPPFPHPLHPPPPHT